MRKLMELVRNGRLNLTPLITHRFSLDDIEDAYELFGNQRDDVVKWPSLRDGAAAGNPGVPTTAGSGCHRWWAMSAQEECCPWLTSRPGWRTWR